jgi:hypothetical protein
LGGVEEAEKGKSLKLVQLADVVVGTSHALEDFIAMTTFVLA